jgi:hypothetical protein
MIDDMASLKQAIAQTLVNASSRSIRVTVAGRGGLTEGPRQNSRMAKP